MIYEINKFNKEKISKSLINLQEVIKDLENNPFGKLIVIEDNDEIIGYLYYSDIYERAEINQIEIETSHRNCGKGDLLLKKMINTVKKSITLEVNMENIPAIKLYEKNGFVRKTIRKGYYNGIDGILMERK